MIFLVWQSGMKEFLVENQQKLKKMKIHSDLSKNAFSQTVELLWRQSPMAGVKRRMIERDGEEVARATSLVSYAAESSFSAHRHDKGEEFLVMDGVFSDETGDFPKGSYVRNPPGSEHSPHSKDGCEIFVKLRQMHLDDQSFVRIDPQQSTWIQSEIPTISYLPLHQFGSENVALIQVEKTSDIWKTDFPHGMELLVISGCLQGKQRLCRGSWLRLAAGERIELSALEKTLFYVKTGHLPQVSSTRAPIEWANLLKI